jgi:hypothetical protein
MSKAIIARYQSGKLDQQEELNKAIRLAWIELMEVPAERARVANIFALPQEDLPKDPPVDAKVDKGGFGLAEVAIAFAAGFTMAIAKDAGAQTAKFTVEQGKKVWAILRRRITSKEPEALGDEIDTNDG